MLPLVPTLILGFISFTSSAFVILRIVIPILPPHPLSRRVPPSEFGLPNFRTLSAADKSHIWLAGCDIFALAIFVWQAVQEYLGGVSGHGIVADPGSAVRLWIATTLRQSCLLVIATLTLVHVRIGQPVGFGAKHWMLWSPTLLLAVVSTGLAGILAGAGVETFFWGLVGYSASVAILSSIAFGCLIGTLVMIRRNLAALHSMRDPWPPVVVEEKSRRRSFATEDINALKDSSSWITSRASSRCESISAFSFSTHHTHHTHHSRVPSNASSRVNVHPNVASYPSIPGKSSYWFTPASPADNAGRESPVPPVPPLPAPYRPSSTYNVTEDPDPFRRVDPRIRLGSQSSWLSEKPGWQYEQTMSGWSYPTSQDSSHEQPHVAYSHTSTPDLDFRTEFLTADFLHSTALNSSMMPSTPLTAAMSTDVLGGYGYAPDAIQAENSGNNPLAQSSNEVDVSMWRAVGWLITIWIPMGLSIPYFVTSQLSTSSTSSSVTSLLLVLSVTLSSPFLAANILSRSPIPIPSGLFDSPSEPPSVIMRAPSPCSSNAQLNVHEYKRSGSTTVIEGRRSGDVWLSNGNAAEQRNKVARALTLLQPKPKLSVLPPQEEKYHDGEFSPPLPIQAIEDQGTVPPTPQSHNPAELGMHQEMGTRKKDSKASSYFSGTDENVAYATKIMVAQRHHSALAMTMVLPPSPKRGGSQEMAATTAVQTESAREAKRHSHLRARSITSMNSPSRMALTPPPSSPLPPTPPTLKNFKAANASKRMIHRKSYSSTAEEFSFGPIENDNTREIDALSAGLLPLLVPGLKVGGDVKITEGWKLSPTLMSGDGNARNSDVPSELGGMFSGFLSPQIHSTPNTRKISTDNRKRGTSSHKRHPLSLPSLGIGKDGVHGLMNWRSDTDRALETKADQYAPLNNTQNDSRRATVYGGETTADIYIRIVNDEDDEASRLSSPGFTTGFPDSLDVPHSIHPDRNSLLTLISALDHELQQPPPSAGSEVTLFNFDPSADGVLESTPHEPKTQIPKRLSRHSDKASRRSSIVYIKSDENSAPPSVSDVHTSPVIRPLVPKPRNSSNHRPKKPAADQENVAPSPKGLKPLSLLQDRDQNSRMVLDGSATKPLNLSKKGKKDKADRENIQRESSLRRALKPLKLVRSETTKRRAALRENEVLPDVVVRPPSDGQHIGFAYNFR